MTDYIHHVPGRLRVRSKSLRGSGCDTEQLCAVLDTLEGIGERRLNAKTGSLLVYYDPKRVCADDILYYMAKSGCLEGGVTAAGQRASSLASMGSVVGSALFGTFVKKSLETSISSFARGLR